MRRHERTGRAARQAFLASGRSGDWQIAAVVGKCLPQLDIFLNPPSAPLPTLPADFILHPSLRPPPACPSIQIASPKTPLSPPSFECLGHPELPRCMSGVTPVLLRYLRKVYSVSCSETQPTSSLSMSSCNRYPQFPCRLFADHHFPADLSPKLPATIVGQKPSVNSAV
jgi:hypothetical protein